MTDSEDFSFVYIIYQDQDMLVNKGIHQLLFRICLFLINVVLTTPKFPTAFPMRWPDTPIDVDSDTKFFSRVVCISLNQSYISEGNHVDNTTVITTGVLINNQLVLTGYNAFRNLSRHKENMKNISVGVLNYRIYYKSEFHSYRIIYSDIGCGRQVIPLRDSDISYDNWHGKDHMHSPLHDLMLLRVKNYTFENKNPKLNIIKDKGNGYNEELAGPLVTVLAKTDQTIGRNVRIASIGHLSISHIQADLYLRPYEFDSDDNVIVDCDQWIPRQWGHFICLRNVHDFVGLSSGAVLFYNSTLYGIGSFALWKGKKGVLVFTDVRPYHGLINETCTVADQI